MTDKNRTTVLLLGFRAKMPEDDERVLDGAGVGEAIGRVGCCCAAGVSTTGVGGDSCARFGTAAKVVTAYKRSKQLGSVHHHHQHCQQQHHPLSEKLGMAPAPTNCQPTR